MKIPQAETVQHPAQHINLEWASPSQIRKQLLKIIEQLDNAKPCFGCGGLVPELIVTKNTKQYTFTCTEVKQQKLTTSDWDGENFTNERVVQEERILKQTDYQKLGIWCIAHYGILEEFRPQLKAILEDSP
jgi:hypothetical protein